MKNIGTISYNIYCNFTNYGSALQTWALHQAIKKTGNNPILIDYCPDVLSDKDPLNPYKNMWDQSDEAKVMVELSLPAIRNNFLKFENFYNYRFNRTRNKYTSDNFKAISSDEHIDGFICGSDTIFCIDEFNGFDDGYYANYKEMQGRSVSYAASFGDSHFDDESFKELIVRLKNFNALGLREQNMIPYVENHVNVPVQQTIDPTLLILSEDYDCIVAERQYDKPYLLLYSRRYDPAMEDYAEKLAHDKGLLIIEISLRASNAKKGHLMRYDAGVEEFLSLVKHSSFVVTNSFHGLIFAVQYCKPLVVFSREQADNKINELLKLMGIHHSKFTTRDEKYHEIDYKSVHKKISVAREASFEFLNMAIGLL